MRVLPHHRLLLFWRESHRTEKLRVARRPDDATTSSGQLLPAPKRGVTDGNSRRTHQTTRSTCVVDGTVEESDNKISLSQHRNDENDAEILSVNIRQPLPMLFSCWESSLLMLDNRAATISAAQEATWTLTESKKMPRSRIVNSTLSAMMAKEYLGQGCCIQVSSDHHQQQQQQVHYKTYCQVATSR